MVFTASKEIWTKDNVQVFLLWIIHLFYLLQFVAMKLYTTVGHLYTPGAEVVHSSSAPISKRIASNSAV